MQEVERSKEYRKHKEWESEDMSEKKLKIECRPPPGISRPPQMMLSKECGSLQKVLCIGQLQKGTIYTIAYENDTPWTQAVEKACVTISSGPADKA